MRREGILIPFRALLDPIDSRQQMLTTIAPRKAKKHATFALEETAPLKKQGKPRESPLGNRE